MNVICTHCGRQKYVRGGCICSDPRDIRIQELESLLQEAREALEMISHLEQWSLDTLDGTMERKDGGDYYLADDVDTIAQQALDRLKGEATPYSPESPLPPHL